MGIGVQAKCLTFFSFFVPPSCDTESSSRWNEIGAIVVLCLVTLTKEGMRVIKERRTSKQRSKRKSIISIKRIVVAICACAPPSPLNSSGTAVFFIFLLVSTLSFSLLFPSEQPHHSSSLTPLTYIQHLISNTCLHSTICLALLFVTHYRTTFSFTTPKDPVTHPSSQAQLQPTLQPQPTQQPTQQSTQPSSKAMTNLKKHVVIIGAGISGLAAGKALLFLLLLTTCDKMTTSRSIFPPSSLVSSILVSLFSLQRKVQAWPPHGGV